MNKELIKELNAYIRYIKKHLTLYTSYIKCLKYYIEILKVPKVQSKKTYNEILNFSNIVKKIIENHKKIIEYKVDKKILEIEIERINLEKKLTKTSSKLRTFLKLSF